MPAPIHPPCSPLWPQVTNDFFIYKDSWIAQNKPSELTTVVEKAQSMQFLAGLPFALQQASPPAPLHKLCDALQSLQAQPSCLAAPAGANGRVTHPQAALAR
jgi:hypothetical protein